MAPFHRKSQNTSAAGAAAGSVLRGVGANNQGLRLRLLQDQPSGNGGPLEGGFVLLDAGDNMHAPFLAPLVGRATTAEEVLRAIRRERRGCVSVANANILAPEEAQGREEP